jgi:hypothetical protein
MAQTTLTLYAGDQLYKSVDLFFVFYALLDHLMAQLRYPAYWDIYWSHRWVASLVYWWVQ